jgi:hypothetical protein
MKVCVHIHTFTFKTSFMTFLLASPTKVTARPPHPARAVLPTRCTYVLALLGISAFSTVCTPGISNPLAATSVATMMSTSLSRNRCNARYLRAWDTSPCSSQHFIPKHANHDVNCYSNNHTNNSNH